jgi:hypothetical protein
MYNGLREAISLVLFAMPTDTRFDAASIEEFLDLIGG